jgi:hypothetical protein
MKAGKKSGKKPRPVGPIIKGCACGKPVGFAGEHRRNCPLRSLKRTTAILNTKEQKCLTIAEFACSIRNAGHQQLVKAAFTLELEMLKKDPMVSPRQRDEAVGAIQALLDELQTH